MDPKFSLQQWEALLSEVRMEDSPKRGLPNLGVASILVAEAIAMRHYVQVVVQAGYSLLVLEGDNQVIIKTLKGEIQVS